MPQGIVIQITGDGAGAAEALRIIEERMQETAKKGEEMSGQLAEAGERIRGAFETMGVAIGIREAVDGLKEMIEKSMEAAVEIGKLHQQTGISTENLSALKYAASQTGVEFDTLTKGFKKLAVSVYDAENGNKKAVEGFEQLGISVSDLKAKGNDMYAILGMIADKFHEMPDGIEKSDAAAKIFSARMGSDLIPVLNQGSAALENYKKKGPIYTDEDIQKMEKMHHAVSDMQSAYAKMSLEVASGAAPVLTAWFNLIASGDSPLTTFEKKIQSLTLAFHQLTGAAKLPTIDLNAAGASAARFYPSAWDADPKAMAGPEKNTGDGDGSPELTDAEKSALYPIYYRFQAIRDLLKQEWQETAKLNEEEGQKAWDALQPQQPDMSAFKKSKPTVVIAHQDWQDAGKPDTWEQDQAMKERMALQAANSIGGFMNQLTEQAERGKLSFKSLADSVISDIERVAMKMMEERYLIPLMQSMFGVGGVPGGGGFNANTGLGASYNLSADTSAFAVPKMAGGGELSGGDMAIVGDSPSGDMTNAELFAPKGPGSILPHSFLEQLAKGGQNGGGGAPSVMINNVNNSSQPVEMKQNGMSWDAQAKQFILHTVLEDAANGGPVAGMMSGFARG